MPDSVSEGVALNQLELPFTTTSASGSVNEAVASGKLDEISSGIISENEKKNLLNIIIDALKKAGGSIRDVLQSGWNLIKTYSGLAFTQLSAAWTFIHSNPYTTAAFYGSLIIVACVAINKMNPGNINELVLKIIENFKQNLIKLTERRRSLQRIQKEQPNTPAAAEATAELNKPVNAKELITDAAMDAAKQAKEEKKAPTDENAKTKLSQRFSDFGAKYGKQIAIGTALAAAATALGAYGYKKVAEGNYQWKEDGLQEELERYIKETYGAEKLPVIKQIVDNVIVDIVNSTGVNNVVGNIKDYKDAETIYNKLTTPGTETDKKLDKIIEHELKEEINKTQQKGGGNLSIPFIQFGGGLQENIEKYANLQNDNDKQDFIQLIDEDPKYSPETTQIATIDRTIFIVGTYIIRTLVLLMIDWGINSHMITTFKQSFEAYISGYIALFLVWVAIANISENEYQENIVLSSLFYYINTRANKLTTFRILLHIFVQISLIPILFIVKYKSSEIDQDSFEQRQGLYNAISQFSFFIWLMTSIIASRF